MGDGGQGETAHRSFTWTRASAGLRRWRISGCRCAPGRTLFFWAALIRYVLENELFFREYVVHYTNARVIIPEDFKDTEDLEGVFSGWNAEKKKYDPKTWLYEGSGTGSGRTRRSGSDGGHAAAWRGLIAADLNKYKQDVTLQHPRCVFQLLKKHFARYTPEMVAAILRRFQGSVSCTPRRRIAKLWSGKNRRDLLRAGMDAALQRRADDPLRGDSCNCFSEIWADRAAASWRCAATRRFKGRPIFRPCTTFFPAI